MANKTVLFDIDGTIADVTHRRGFLSGEKPDWSKFNGAMGDDTPNSPVCGLYKILWKSGAYDLFLLTGRHEKHRKITEQWLICNEIPFSKVLMRKDKDNRADHIVKEEMLDSFVKIAPQPGIRQAVSRDVHPNESDFSGFTFKIQANMDPEHRDRIAFFRICSGKFTKGMKVRHHRIGKEIKISITATFS